MSERRANIEKDDVQADPTVESGKLIQLGETSEEYTQLLHRGSGGSMYTRKRAQHGKPQCVIRDDQPDAREGQAGRTGVAERLIVCA